MPPRTWVNATTPAINDDNLNALEADVVTAQATADTAVADAAAAVTAAADAMTAHVADTTNIHGIADTTVLAATTAAFTTAKDSKLTGIEALADVTDTANVIAAGAAMLSVWDPVALDWDSERDPNALTWTFRGTTSDTSPTPADANTKVGDVWEVGPGHSSV